MTRLPSSLHEWIRDQADHDHRSLNAQIVYLLEQARSAQLINPKG